MVNDLCVVFKDRTVTFYWHSSGTFEARRTQTQAVSSSCLNSNWVSSNLQLQLIHLIYELAVFQQYLGQYSRLIYKMTIDFLAQSQQTCLIYCRGVVLDN